jgi:hypothetical protein
MKCFFNAEIASAARSRPELFNINQALPMLLLKDVIPDSKSGIE